MEERLKLLEGKIDVAMNTLAQVDRALVVLFKHLEIEKAFFDSLQVSKPVEQPQKQDLPAS